MATDSDTADKFFVKYLRSSAGSSDGLSVNTVHRKLPVLPSFYPSVLASPFNDESSLHFAKEGKVFLRLCQEVGKVFFVVTIRDIIQPGFVFVLIFPKNIILLS